MPYKIIFMKNELEIGETPWNSTLETAKEHAKDHMQINEADRVEVRDDENNALLFHHPRMLRT